MDARGSADGGEKRRARRTWFWAEGKPMCKRDLGSRTHTPIGCYPLNASLQTDSACQHVGGWYGYLSSNRPFVLRTELGRSSRNKVSECLFKPKQLAIPCVQRRSV